MSTNYEMCFCDTKISSQNVFEILNNLIKKAGWIPVAEVNCLWAYGPSASLKYSRKIDEKDICLLLEEYNYYQNYNEYHLSFSPEYTHDNPFILPKHIYDLILLILNTVDFFCGNMGLETYGFESYTNASRYDVLKEEKVYLTDTLLDLAYLSKNCIKRCYDISPSMISSYDCIKLNNGNLYIRKGLLR